MSPQRTQRETARVQLRSRSPWRAIFVLFILMAGAAVAALHYFVIPVDVLVAWLKPARLSIATEPDGATVRLDGVTLAAPSPTAVSVKRDLADHVIEATLPGYRPARAIARYERSLGLSFLLRLQKDPTAVVPVPPPTGPPDPVPPSPTAVPPH
jgi:PEGA domain